MQSAGFPRAAGLVLGLAFFGLGGASGTAAEVPFRVGQAAPANTFLAIWMAQAAGFYQAQELKLEIVPMTGGSESGPDLKSGRIHLMHIGMSSVVRANTSGSGDLRCIGSPESVLRQIRRFESLGIELLLCKVIPTTQNVQRIGEEIIAPLRGGATLPLAS